MRFLECVLLLAGIAGFALLSSRPLSAQQDAVITGRVTTELGTPLGAANVFVVNTGYYSFTAADGTYTLTIPGSAAQGQEVQLSVRHIGYKVSTRTVTLTPGRQEQDFQIETDPLRLEELVVTGVGQATARNKLTFSAATVTTEDMPVPGGSALVAIQGKVAGARLVPTSSQPGGEVSIRLRGATSISGRQDPLIIVDGVITRFGLADVAPEDIERVEVIKGAAATALYGSNAANGVVQVFTKRGASLPEGTLRLTSRIEAGINEMPSRMEFSRSHAWKVDASGEYVLNESGGRIIEEDQIADNPFSLYNNHWDEVVDNGAFWTGYFSVGQRRAGTNFNASYQNTRNQGVIFGLGGYTRHNFRLNIDQQLRTNLDASFSAFYGTSTNGRTEEGQGGPFFGLMFLQPDVDILAPNPDGSPYRARVPLSGDVANDFNPLYELANRKIDQDRNRFTGSARARWRMMNWLSAEGSFAYDQEAETYSDVTPFGFLSDTGTPTDGFLLKRQDNNYQFNTGATLTSVRGFGAATNITRIGVSFEDQRNRFLSSSAAQLRVARVPEFNAADPAIDDTDSRDERIKNQNFFGVTTFDIKDRYIVDGLVRQDESSLFGPESRSTTYYRISGAWRISEDVRIPGFDEFRLRASYGTAGLRPEFTDRYEILAVTPGGFTKNILGNPFLKPARSSELELGTNLAFGNGRYTLEYSHARKETKDQILLVDLPAAVGFRQQWQNTGAVEAKTHEIAFAARVLDRPDASLTINIVGDRTRQVITEWNLPERLYSFQQMPSAFFLGTGSNLGVLYGNRWVRSIDELYDDPEKQAQSGAGQAFDRENFMLNEDGYVVFKSAYGTPDERAIKYVRCKRQDASGNCAETTNIVQIGDANPNFNLSLGTTLNFKRLSVSGLLDMSRGGDLYNGTRQWAFQATRDRAQDQAGKPEAAKKPLAYYAVGFYNGLDPNDYFVEDGSYAKLKELSVMYTFGSDQLQRVGLRGVQDLRLGFVGRNLFTITDYSGLDPEVSGLFGDPFQVRMDWFQYPQFRTFSVVAEITF
jgi:TonB-linked SusC/RagA family outer membrane protein